MNHAHVDEQPSAVAFASAFLVLSALAMAPATAAPTVAPAPPPPAEEFRLSPTVFREGLKKRGLMELLERHVQRFPPVSETESLLLQRDLRLAEFADMTRPREHRQAAIGEANQLLEQVIEQNQDDSRRFEWRYALAHSLLYEEGEPFATNILFRGGSAADRAALGQRTGRAVAALTGLEADVAREYERLDKLPAKEFERLEASGHVERMDELQPRVGYLLSWALFYDAGSRGDADETRARELTEVLDRLSRDRTILTTPHEHSHVQIQAVLLGGMTLRRLNRLPEARELFDRAILVAGQITDPAERRSVQWAVTLAWIERIRGDADDARYDEAAAGLKRFRASIDADLAGDFGLRIVAGLLERSVLRRRAAAAEAAGRPADARRYRRDSWEPLAQLARQSPDRRDEVNSVVYAGLGREIDSGTLDPFEQSAVIAGLLYDAGQDASVADKLLDRAAEIGGRFLDRYAAEAPALVPEVLYNAGVAEYRRGRLDEAAGRFLRIAKEFPAFERAPQAAAYAVQLGAERYGDAALRERPEVRQLYREALETLLSGYAASEPARYWQFHYAQLLEESEDFDAAAKEYAQVEPSHEHYDHSVYSRARCLAMALHKVAGRPGADRSAVALRMDEFFATQRSFDALARAAIDAGADAEQKAILTRLLASLRVTKAEVELQPLVNQPATAVETLASFDRDFPDASDLTGRVWRARLMGYERLGRLEDATKAIPAYVAADPIHAGPTLQSLYAMLSAESERERAGGDEREAARKADMALVLAQQLSDWVLQSEEASGPFDRFEVALQLAEANLRAGHYRQAVDLFDRLRRADTGSTSPSPSASDLRVIVGYAESLYRTEAYDKALPEFNRLATTLADRDPRRWSALLRDLQCRTALKHPPEGILKVIQQQRFLHADLGGAGFAPEFEKLQRENERRQGDKP